MNKYKDALTYLRNSVLVTNHKQKEMVNQCTEVLKELVDKATPKKAVYKDNKDADGYIYYERICPNCKKYVDKYAEYCIYCNQRLDWSDEDE